MNFERKIYVVLDRECKDSYMEIKKRFTQLYFLNFPFTGVASNLCQFIECMFRNVASGSHGKEDV